MTKEEFIKRYVAGDTLACHYILENIWGGAPGVNTPRFDIDLLHGSSTLTDIMQGIA